MTVYVLHVITYCASTFCAARATGGDSSLSMLMNEYHGILDRQILQCTIYVCTTIIFSVLKNMLCPLSTLPRPLQGRYLDIDKCLDISKLPTFVHNIQDKEIIHRENTFSQNLRERAAHVQTVSGHFPLPRNSVCTRLVCIMHSSHCNSITTYVCMATHHHIRYIVVFISWDYNLYRAHP